VVSCDSSVWASYGCMLTRATRKYATRALSQISDMVCDNGVACALFVVAAAAAGAYLSSHRHVLITSQSTESTHTHCVL
jgi:hypothetical protein